MKESTRRRRLGKDRLVLALDSHALTYFQTCNKMYYLSQAEKLVQIRSRRAFEIGTMVHDIMHRVTRAKLNRREFNSIQLLEIGYKVIRRAAKAGLLNAEQMVFHSVKYTQYVSWMQAQERFYKPLGNEVGFSKVLYEDSDVIFAYEGRIDLILRVEPAGFNAWADYKTQGREYSLYKNRNQFLGYSWAVGTNMGFLIYYGLQKEKEEPFRLDPVFHHPDLIKQWVEDTTKSFRKIISLIPFGEDAFERNRSACDSGKFGNCQFLPICDNAWAGSRVNGAIRKGFFKESNWTPWD
jgi:hypothetical protein